MDNSCTATLTEKFSILKDPRINRTKRHNLIDLVVIGICAVVCGSDSWVDMEVFGNSKKRWLSKILELPNGIPSHDTFGRVFSMLDAEQFETCFSEWVLAVSEVTNGQVIAIDGKTVRRSADRFIGKDAIHMVSAWSSANHMVIGQTRVDGRSNEITAIPKLLRILDVSGCIVTIDAMGCQKKIASTIIDKGADYVLSLKANQPRLHTDVGEIFEHGRQTGFADIDHDFFQTIEKGHGRIETRSCLTISDPEYLNYVNDRQEWRNLTTIAMVESERVVDGSKSVATRFYISSLPGRADLILSASRGHWGVENSLHWVLDVAFREDDSRARMGNAAENLSIMRRMALNMLKNETTPQGGVAAKRKRAGWDNDYLLMVLAQQNPIDRNSGAV